MTVFVVAGDLLCRPSNYSIIITITKGLFHEFVF